MAQLALEAPPDEAALAPPPAPAAATPRLALAPNNTIEPMTFAQADDGLSFSELVKQRIDRAVDIHVKGAGIVKEVAKAIHPFTPVGIGESIGVDLVQRPGEFAPVFNAAERQTRLVDNMFGKDASIEEAYDRRIKAVKDATGVTLENPERGGYSLSERELRRLSQDEPIDPTAYRRLMFEGKLRAVREAHPDKTEALSFGDIQKESEAIAAGAEQEYERARADTTLSGPSSFAMQAGGAMWGMRRDPLFVGSLFAGPTGAVGKEVATRIATSALFQGLYNAGITALEQPSVQAWRAEIGAKSGVLPAAANVGMAFLTGVIPGAVLRGIHEEISAVARRVLTSREPLPGDVEALTDAVTTMLTPQDRAAIRVGEAMDEADRVANPPPTPNVAPELREDLKAAALRQADDPYNSPSPEGVAAVNHIEVFHGSPHDFEAFDISKIGTGEGAQSYGHGLYFAENEAVARNYKAALADVKIGGRPFDINNPVHKAVALVDELGSREAAIAEAKSNLVRDPGDTFYADVVSRLESDKALPKLEQTGNLYRARINANREHFIDYDKPLSEQSQFVRNALENNPDPMIAGTAAKWGYDVPAMFERIGHRLAEREAGGSLPEGAGTVASHRVAVSKMLSEAGIPGIKYLDQGSRDAGDGSRNYVVFNDKLIDITHKNDLPLSPKMQEVADRVAEAQPRSLKEAQMAASEAIEEQGTKATATRLQTELNAPAYTLEESFDLGSKAPLAPRSSKDPLDKIPLPDDDGTFRMKSAQDIARVGERETDLADLIRACK